MQAKGPKPPKRVYHVTTYEKNSVCRSYGYTSFAKAMRDFRITVKRLTGLPVRVSLEITWEGTKEVGWYTYT